MYKALILDLDGTIADTLPAILAALNATMRRFGYPEHDIAALKGFINNGARTLISRALPESAREPEHIDTVLADYTRSYTETFAETTETYPQIDRVVRTLHERGIRIAILSNKQDYMVKRLADQLLPNLISCAYGQRAGYPIKPDPTVPLAVAAELGVQPSEVVFVGDSDVDIVTAQNAGFLPVGVAWGYRPAELLREMGAEHILASAEELLSFFS